MLANVLSQKWRWGVVIKSHLKEIMLSKGVTMAQLAKDAGIAIETIRRARGDDIRLCRLETLEAIAAALNVSIRDLFEE
jgi:DNA-binding Xre family transcriptional regulator